VARDGPPHLARDFTGVTLRDSSKQSSTGCAPALPCASFQTNLLAQRHCLFLQLSSSFLSSPREPLAMSVRMKYFAALILMLLITAASTGQQPGPQTNRRDEDDVVRITTNLVQVDAVVTDKEGKRVTDLKPGEVQIFEDDRQQKITNFSYVPGLTAEPRLI